MNKESLEIYSLEIYMYILIIIDFLCKNYVKSHYH